MRLKWYCFLAVILMAFTKGKAISVHTIDTTSDFAVRQYNAADLEKYRSDKDFNYYTETADDEGGTSVWQLVSNFLDDLLGSNLGGFTTSDIITYALMLFAAIMLIIQVFKVTSPKMFSKNSEVLANFSVETQSIHKVQFDQLIEEARANGNYRLAIRMYYLKTLKALSDAGHINWQANKTNFEYCYELRGENIRNEFQSLTTVFESAWYGHHDISAEVFSGTVSSFDHFFTLIKKR